jgi:hypothetical protein
MHDHSSFLQLTIPERTRTIDRSHVLLSSTDKIPIRAALPQEAMIVFTSTYNIPIRIVITPGSHVCKHIQACFFLLRLGVPSYFGSSPILLRSPFPFFGPSLTFLHRFTPLTSGTPLRYYCRPPEGSLDDDIPSSVPTRSPELD